MLRTGEPQHMREITDELLEAGARDAEHLEIIREPGPVLGDDRPAAGAQSDARRDHLRVRGVRAPVRRGGPRVRVRARAPGRAVGRQRAPAQRAGQPQHRSSGSWPTRASSSTRRSTSSETLQKLASSRSASRCWRRLHGGPAGRRRHIVRVAARHGGPGGTRRARSAARAATSTSTARTRSRCDAHRPAPAGRDHRRRAANWTTDDRYLEPSRLAGASRRRRADAGARRCWARSRSLRSATGGSARTTCGSCASSRGGPPSPSTTRACTKETNYIADRLQRSLLPPHLPDIRGVEIAARFRPAGDRNDVGGDFYDIFQTGPNRWAITIGDVCGKGRRRRGGHGPGAPHAARNGDPRRTNRPTSCCARSTTRCWSTTRPTSSSAPSRSPASSVGDGSTRLAVSSGGHPLPDRAARRRRGRVRRRAGHAARRGPRPGRCRAPRSSSSAATRWSSTRTGSPRRAPRRGMFGHEGLLRALRDVRGLRRCRDRGADRSEHAGRADRAACATTSRWWWSRSRRARVPADARRAGPVRRCETLDRSAYGGELGLRRAAGRGPR